MSTIDIRGDAHPLSVALQMAVPLEVDRLRRKPKLELWLMTRSFPELIGTYGDQLLYGGKHAGEVFAAVATGTAALLLCCPGGITLFGVHFCEPAGVVHGSDGRCVDIQRCPREAA